jgi:hypothetical protein
MGIKQILEFSERGGCVTFSHEHYVGQCREFAVNSKSIFCAPCVILFF